MTSTTENIKQQLAEAVKRHKSGQIQAALDIHQDLLKQFPGHPQILYLSGLAYQDLGDLRHAMSLISQATALEPNNGLFHGALGIILKKLGYNQAALERLKDAQQRDPNRAEIHFHLGDTHINLGEAQKAQPHFRQAIALEPNFKEAWLNLGLCLKACKQLQEALTCFQRVVDDHPQAIEGHINLGLTHLLMGNYALGWQSYEWRLQLEDSELSITQAALPQNGKTPHYWNGVPLAGKTILVLAEQGFGDIIQFVRYLTPLKEAGARIILTSPISLKPLFQNLTSVDRILPPPRLGITTFQDQIKDESIDAFCPLISLPRILQTRVATIPAKIPYLQADATLVAQWRYRFRSTQIKPSIRIGLVWRGKPLHKNDPLRRRSCPLKDLLPLTQIEDITLFSLQKEDDAASPGDSLTKDSLAKLEITDLQSNLTDFAQTAAILTNMDLLISIDTSVAHLGGALGIPTWVLLPFSPDWRWFLDQETTPWYPTIRLFRQTVANGWQEPIEQISTALPAFTKAIMEQR